MSTSAKRDVKRNHNRSKVRAGQIVTALEEVGGKEALKLRFAILTQMKIIEDAGSQMEGTHGAASTLRTESATADRQLKAGVDGVVALVNLADPKLGARLPTRDGYAGVSDDAYAEVVASALEEAGAASLAALLAKGKNRQVAIARKYAATETNGKSGSVHSTKTELAQLGLLMQQAVVLVRRSVPAGSPILDRLKVGGRPKKEGSEPAPKASSPPSTSVAPVEPASPPAVAAAPIAAPAQVMNGASA